MQNSFFFFPSVTFSSSSSSSIASCLSESSREARRGGGGGGSRRGETERTPPTISPAHFFRRRRRKVGALRDLSICASIDWTTTTTSSDSFNPFREKESVRPCYTRSSSATAGPSPPRLAAGFKIVSASTRQNPSNSLYTWWL